MLISSLIKLALTSTVLSAPARRDADAYSTLNSAALLNAAVSYEVCIIAYNVLDAGSILGGSAPGFNCIPPETMTSNITDSSPTSTIVSIEEVPTTIVGPSQTFTTSETATITSISESSTTATTTFSTTTTTTTTVNVASGTLVFYYDVPSPTQAFYYPTVSPIGASYPIDSASAATLVFNLIGGKCDKAADTVLDLYGQISSDGTSAGVSQAYLGARTDSTRSPPAYVSVVPYSQESNNLQADPNPNTSNTETITSIWSLNSCTADGNGQFPLYVAVSGFSYDYLCSDSQGSNTANTMSMVYVSDQPCGAGTAVVAKFIPSDPTTFTSP